MSPTTIALLAAANVLLIFGLMAAPIGLRTIRLSRQVKAGRDQIWSALWPLGENALWSGEFLEVRPDAGREDRARVKLQWTGHDGAPIERTLRFENVVEGERFASVVDDDSSLAQDFWSSYREKVTLSDTSEGTLVSFERTDRYRGAAFLVFRYFAMRRELSRLQSWAETGAFNRSGLFERPVTQAGFAILSAFLIWPIFGLTFGGFILASILTSVVALHELGHMAAFRVMGHRHARMIFIPLLGGIAIGGRPYNTRFEVGFVALMGAGFSAFLIPITIAASGLAGQAGYVGASAMLATLAGCAALFNIANLVPVWKFDGGQVLRQICPNGFILAVASFVALSAFLGIGYSVGFSPQVLIAAGVVFAVLSLITAGSGVTLRHELKAIVPAERVMLALAFTAVFAIHGYGLVWAAARLT